MTRIVIKDFDLLDLSLNIFEIAVIVVLAGITFLAVDFVKNYRHSRKP
jgi:hypothetical protein